MEIEEKTVPGPKEPEGVAADFVCIGKRTGSKFPLVDGIQWLNPDGTLGEKAFYKPSRSHRIIGGIYRGARRTATQIIGHDRASYIGRWEDKAQLADWEAETFAAESVVNAKKLEGKQQGFVAQEIEGLRQVYAAYKRRGDYHMAHAFKQLILAELERPVKE